METDSSKPIQARKIFIVLGGILSGLLILGNWVSGNLRNLSEVLSETLFLQVLPILVALGFILFLFRNKSREKDQLKLLYLLVPISIQVATKHLLVVGSLVDIPTLDISTAHVLLHVAALVVLGFVSFKKHMSVKKILKLSGLYVFIVFAALAAYAFYVFLYLMAIGWHA